MDLGRHLGGIGGGSLDGEADSRSMQRLLRKTIKNKIGPEGKIRLLSAKQMWNEEGQITSEKSAGGQNRGGARLVGRILHCNTRASIEGRQDEKKTQTRWDNQKKRKKEKRERASDPHQYLGGGGTSHGALPEPEGGGKGEESW